MLKLMKDQKILKNHRFTFYKFLKQNKMYMITQKRNKKIKKKIWLPSKE